MRALSDTCSITWAHLLTSLSPRAVKPSRYRGLGFTGLPVWAVCLPQPLSPVNLICWEPGASPEDAGDMGIISPTPQISWH